MEYKWSKIQKESADWNAAVAVPRDAGMGCGR